MSELLWFNCPPHPKAVDFIFQLLKHRAASFVLAVAVGVESHKLWTFEGGALGGKWKESEPVHDPNMSQQHLACPEHTIFLQLVPARLFKRLVCKQKHLELGSCFVVG